MLFAERSHLKVDWFNLQIYIQIMHKFGLTMLFIHHIPVLVSKPVAVCL